MPYTEKQQGGDALYYLPEVSKTGRQSAAGLLDVDGGILPCDSRVSLDEDRRLVYDRWRNKSGD